MKKYILQYKYYITILLLVILLTTIFLINVFKNYKTPFQADSETLVTGLILVNKELKMNIPYGLARYSNIKGDMYHYSYTDINDNNWQHSYSTSRNAFAVRNGFYNRKYLVAENTIIFNTGYSAKIIGTEVNQQYINVFFNKPVNITLCGQLDLLKIQDKNGKIEPIGEYSCYTSQYGLQGKIYSIIAKILPKKYFRPILLVINSLLTAIVLSLIVFFIVQKFNILLGGCFFITFITSPWIVNFAPNLYWVEYTWFIPMLIGLLCSIYRNSKKILILCYISIGFAIFIKSLCGYEYLSTIMLSSILFPCYDAIKHIFDKDFIELKKDIKIIIILSIISLSGFTCAILLHSYYRGNSSILSGIKSIFIHDVLRRTYGNADNFNKVFANSLNSSPLTVINFYISKWTTNILLNIKGKYFPIFITLPLIFTVINRDSMLIQKIKRIIIQFITIKHNWIINNRDIFIFYFLTAVSSLSWIVLAKGHSYVHRHMNYVLWYFGFVQIILYYYIQLIFILFNYIYCCTRAIIQVYRNKFFKKP